MKLLRAWLRYCLGSKKAPRFWAKDETLYLSFVNDIFILCRL